jgi:hypothetical protein
MLRNLLGMGLLLSIGPAGCESSDMFTTGGQDTPAPFGVTRKWSFDTSGPGTLPPEFINVLGDWQVSAEGSAPSSPNLLRQSGSYKSGDFPRVLVKDLTFTNLRMKVRCRPESGSTDQACGVLFRAKDSDNYYVTRANAIENNIRLYHVIERARQEFATADVPVPAGTWHTLEVRALGNAITVSWNGSPVISAMDQTFTTGKIGLWTKADSVTAFDDLEATAE